MRTVHAYTPAQQQQQQQQQTSLSSSTNQPNLHHHPSMSGYPSVRHSLLRMHSQLRSASNRRESTQGPIDLSLYRVPRQTPKMTTRSTSTATTALRSVPIITPLVTMPTHNTYSDNVSFSSTTSQTATSTMNHEQNTKMQNLSSTSDISKCSSSSSSSHCISVPSPKLAYSYTNIEENLQCPLCIDRLRDPRALPCQHVFCCSCIKSIPSSNLPYPTISCPLCRRTFPYNGADQFPISYIHRQLLELVPKNYDINGKCTKCQEKTSLILCSCCDFLLCQKCYLNDREKILDNIKHIVQTCNYRLKRIHKKNDQINEVNDINRKTIQQIQKTFENFEKKYLEHKQTVLNSINKFNEEINQNFWSKLNFSSKNIIEPTNLLKQAEILLKKSHTAQFDDILSLFYHLNSINEQLEQANTTIDTYEIQNLLKQKIQINNNNDSDEQISIQLNQIDNTKTIFPFIPPTIIPRTTKRLRKTEPKRHIEQIDDDDEEDYDDDDNLQTIKQMKVECHNEINFDPLSSPTNSIFCLNFPNDDQQQNEINDDDIIYLETIQAKSPPTPNFEELLHQIISTNE